MKRDRKSSPLVEYVTFSAVFIAYKRRKPVFWLVTGNLILHNYVEPFIYGKRHRTDVHVEKTKCGQGAFSTK